MNTYTDVSKTKATQIARRARQHGYFNGAPNDGTALAAWVNCPECGSKVVGWSNSPYRPADRVRGLDAAMVDHLVYGDCSAHPCPEDQR